MNRALAIFARLAIILMGYAAASLGASAFFNVMMLGAAGLDPDTPVWALGMSLAAGIPVVTLVVAYFAFFPALVAIVVGEFLSVRDWLYYAIAGGFVGAGLVALLWYASTPQDYFGELEIDQRLFLTTVGCGMIGGMAYWLVAGRSAGNLRGRNSAPPTLPAPSGS